MQHRYSSIIAESGRIAHSSTRSSTNMYFSSGRHRNGSRIKHQPTVTPRGCQRSFISLLTNTPSLGASTPRNDAGLPAPIPAPPSRQPRPRPAPASCLALRQPTLDTKAYPAGHRATRSYAHWLLPASAQLLLRRHGPDAGKRTLLSKTKNRTNQVDRQP